MGIVIEVWDPQGNPSDFAKARERRYDTYGDVDLPPTAGIRAFRDRLPEALDEAGVPPEALGESYCDGAWELNIQGPWAAVGNLDTSFDGDAVIDVIVRLCDHVGLVASDGDEILAATDLVEDDEEFVNPWDDVRSLARKRLIAVRRGLTPVLEDYGYVRSVKDRRWDEWLKVAHERYFSALTYAYGMEGDDQIYIHVHLNYVEKAVYFEQLAEFGDPPEDPPSADDYRFRKAVRPNLCASAVDLHPRPGEWTLDRMPELPTPEQLIAEGVRLLAEMEERDRG